MRRKDFLAPRMVKTKFNLICENFEEYKNALISSKYN
jgi:hypothetical protein